MNKKQKKDYYEGIIYLCLLFIVGLFVDKTTEIMLLIIAMIGIRFVALSRNDANEVKDE